MAISSGSIGAIEDAASQTEQITMQMAEIQYRVQATSSIAQALIQIATALANVIRGVGR